VARKGGEVALILSWEKRRPVGLSGFMNREMLWLWCKLEAKDYDLDQKLVVDFDSRANHLIDSVAESETVGSLRAYRDECFSKRLDDSEFNWIDYKNKRLMEWLIEILFNNHFSVTLAVTSFDESILKLHERIKLAFDLSELSIQIKKEVMASLRQMWSLLLDVDPFLDWIDMKDNDQCRWLVDEIKRSDLSPYISYRLQFPVDNEGRYLLFVNALDRSNYPLKFKTLYLSDIKAKWNRKKKKESAEKVQCNLNVDLFTKEHIKELAESRGLKMGELIDALVAEERERERKY
jgi:hypothetical protein